MFEFLKKKVGGPSQKKEKVEIPASDNPIAYALLLLKNMVEEESCIEGNSLILVREKMKYTIGFDGIEERNGNFVSHMYLWAEHPMLINSVYEMCSGIGETLEDAIECSVKSFIYAAYDCWKLVLKDQWCGGFTTEVQKNERKWHFCGSKKALMGNEAEVDSDYCLWMVIQEEAKKYLGALECYWIKIYIGIRGDMNVSEVRINDARIEELSLLLQEYAANLPLKGENYYSEKQFFFLKQDSSTFVPYPYSKKEIKQKVESALRLKWQCYQEEQDKYYRGLEQICGEDGMLFIELDCFLREMAAIYAYQEEVTIGEEIFAFRNNEIKESYYSTQFSAYDWIRQTMLSLFGSKELPHELFALLISESAIGTMIQNGEEEDKRIEKRIEKVRGFGIVDEDFALRVR